MQDRGDAREFPQHIFPELLAAAAAQPPRKANPLWPCGTPGSARPFWEIKEHRRLKKT